MGISLKNVYYTYQEGSPFEGQALSDISLEIKDGSYSHHQALVVASLLCCNY